MSQQKIFFNHIADSPLYPNCLVCLPTLYSNGRLESESNLLDWLSLKDYLETKTKLITSTTPPASHPFDFPPRLLEFTA